MKKSVNNKFIASQPQSQLGVTLIEAMVSLLIFSVGALGLAAMQLTAVSASGDNQQRSIAIWKAQELADRIRSNPNLSQAYVTRIGNQTLGTLGVDSAANVVNCGAGVYTQPATFCADTLGQDAADCNDAQKVAYDIWEVFCEANTGLAVVGGGGANAVSNGSVGLTNVEVVLRQNTQLVDGDNDMLLFFEWVSRQADSNDDLANVAQLINTDLCGLENVPVSSNLDVYCLRFQPSL